MNPDPALNPRGWLALSCTPDGTIVQILRDDIGFARAGGPGQRLPSVVDSGSERKAENLIASLRERACVVGWQMNVPADQGARPLYFAGAASEESLLILAAPGPESVAELFEDVASANVATSQALRTLLHEQRSGITASMSRDNQLYDELSRLNNELINRERELARKSAALERVSAEKSRLVAIAAHDLRNPLTVIAAYADLLKMDTRPEEESAAYIEEIGRSARFMIELVEEMLDASQTERGQLELHRQPVDLVKAAAHAATINRMRAERKQIEIAFEQRTEQAIISADPVKLRQIINNLVVNAVKFSPSHTIVTIRVMTEGARAVIEIEDQGIGIPADKQTVIFEPFTTLVSTGTAGEKSTGLGLSIVKQLAAVHSATIDVQSEEGRGSLFRVSFPIAAVV